MFENDSQEVIITKKLSFSLERRTRLGLEQPWRPLAVKRGSCDFNDVVASGHNQLWRPLAAKFRL